MFYIALGANIFGAISVWWCGFYFNRMALCKNIAEECFGKLSHFRLDTLPEEVDLLAIRPLIRFCISSLAKVFGWNP